MEPIAGLKLVKSDRAGDKSEYGAHLLLLLLLQVVVAIHGLLLGVVKGHVKTLTLPTIHPRDQHPLHTDHDVGLARRHLGRTAICPCFYGCHNFLPVLPDGT